MASPLSYKVADFLRRIAKQPAAATDPYLIEELQAACDDDWEGSYVTLATPVADWTWETAVTFAGAATESQLAPLEFPKPVRIVGMYPTVRPVTLPLAGGAVAPTIDDVLVSLTVDKKDRYTQRQETSNTTNAGQQEFVTLGAISQSLNGRLFALEIDSPTPKIAFQYRWKQPPLASGVGTTFVDSIISVACFVQWKSETTGRWGGKR